MQVERLTVTLPDNRPLGEARDARRFSLLIRIAKLVGESGEFLCIVRDVSETGVRLKLFHPLAAESRLALELANGDVYFIEKVWETDDQAGFRFSAPIDVDAFIAETGGRPRRPIRLAIRGQGWIESGGRRHPVDMVNISLEGAGLVCENHLAVGQAVKLSVQGLPGLIGNVCWRSAPAYGMMFRNYFGIGDLARMTASMQIDVSRPMAASC